MKCKNCRNLVKRIDDDGILHDFCGMVIDSPDVEVERDCKYYVTATNADRIRAMSDEELAEYLDGICHDLWKLHVADPKKIWLDWLKQEAE